MLGKRKRSEQLESQKFASLRQVLVEQIDLEIALKKRLLDAAQARIEWINILRSSILNPRTGSAEHGHPLTSFRDTALTKYETIEETCQVIISANQPLPFPSTNGKPLMSSPMPVSEPRTRKRVALSLALGSSVGPILFEDRSTSIPFTLKLVCIDCSRSDFPTMQGFLNHCRLAHSRIYGTHDECIQATGVIIDSSEREILLASGVEINTVHLLSLRGMFERAVGLAPRNASFPAHIKTSGSIEDPSQVSTHLSQTLGLHWNSPTLAPFLGKQVKKKCIHVYDESRLIDICSHDEIKSPYFVKHRRRRDIDDGCSIYLSTLSTERNNDIESPPHMLFESLNSQVSRFHVTRRVLVSDRSHFLPQPKRPATAMSHTHRWQICVTSPSYDQHITTFLSRLTVTCLTDPPVFTSPITVSAPPFIVCSTTDKPFFAHLTLKWVGEHNHPFEVDHWVELDQLKAGRPVLGDEQIFDVELDRNTIFLPVRDAANTVPWDGHGDHRMADAPHNLLSVSPNTSAGDMPSASDPEHIKLLKSLVTRFPVVSKDLASRQPRLPYSVYPSRVKLLSLVPGRRKATEWGRALAIRSEYDAVIASSSSSGNMTRLTTADVYRWLDRECLFPRHRTKPVKPPPQLAPTKSMTPPCQSLQRTSWFCPVCGVDVRFHAQGVSVNSGDKDESEIGSRCPTNLERSRAPLVHVYALIAPSRIPYSYRASHYDYINITSSTPQDIVTLAHPQLTRFVRQEIISLALSSFGVAQGMESDTTSLLVSKDSVGWGREQVEEVLWPNAFLATILGSLVRDLVGSGLQVAREMHTRTKILSNPPPLGSPMSLLTPTHILQGLLMKDSDFGGTRDALSKCFSRVGTLLEMGGATGNHSRTGGGAVQPLKTK